MCSSDLLIVDYFFIRKRVLYVSELYSDKGRYWYKNGFNRAAIWALLAGILPNVPGFLTTVKLIPVDSVPPLISGLYHYAWFVGFSVSGLCYYFLQRNTNEQQVSGPT